MSNAFHEASSRRKERGINRINNYLQVLKKNSVVEVIVPKFKEFSVENIWPMVKDVPDLIKFFPDFKDKQKCDRTYMFQVLASTRYDEISNMIKNARKNRSLLENNDEAETILIHKDLLEEINFVMTQKSKEANNE